ncbi:transposase, partial [mine drainage metagenome]
MARKRVLDSKTQRLRSRSVLHPHPERVRDPLFEGTAFFDPRDQVQVRYEMLRRVQTEKHPVSETTRLYGVSRPTFYQAQKRFSHDGLVGLVSQRRGPRHGHKITEEVLQALREARTEDPSRTPRDLARWVEERLGVHVHPRSVSRALEKKPPRRRFRAS